MDATVGAGGHAEAILERIGPEGRLIGIDRDQAALEVAGERLGRFGAAVVLVHGSFVDVGDTLAELGISRVDGIVMDLGLSSLQLDDRERGFSFREPGPLDMRMDRNAPVRAADLVNRAPEDELRRILHEYGEERWARRIAAAIVRARPLQTTTQLAAVVERGTPRRSGPRRIHPATRTFQALRIAVNDELNALSEALPNAVEGLRDGGRLCVISFHSLEDRIVKHTFLRLSREKPSGSRPSTRSLQVLTRRPVRPSLEEISRNPRARSARLRAAERINAERFDAGVR